MSEDYYAKVKFQASALCQSLQRTDARENSFIMVFRG